MLKFLFGHCHRVPYLLLYQISSKSDDFSLRYGDLTNSKMAAILTFKVQEKRPCRTSYWSLIRDHSYKLFFFRKSRFVYAFEATDRQTGGQHHRVKPPKSRSVAQKSVKQELWPPRSADTVCPRRV